MSADPRTIAAQSIADLQKQVLLYNPVFARAAALQAKIAQVVKELSMSLMQTPSNSHNDLFVGVCTYFDRKRHRNCDPAHDRVLARRLFSSRRQIRVYPGKKDLLLRTLQTCQEWIYRTSNLRWLHRVGGTLLQGLKARKCNPSIRGISCRGLFSRLARSSMAVYEQSVKSKVRVPKRSERNGG